MRLILAAVLLTGLAAFAAATPSLVVIASPDGRLSAAGELPAGLTPRDLARRLPDIDLSAGVTQTRLGAPAPWDRALDALTLALPRLAEGRAQISGRRIVISGTLRPGFSAEALRSALRLTLGQSWQAEVEIVEAPPMPRVEITADASGTTVRGLLPRGLEPTAALALLDGARDDGLTGGAAGNPAVWRQALATANRLLAVHTQAVLRLAPGHLFVSGRLRSGQSRMEIAAWLAERLGEGWKVVIESEETPATEGTLGEDVPGSG